MMDAKQEAELRKQGWTQVEDDLISPELVDELKRRIAESDPSEGITWELMVAEVEAEEQQSRNQQRSSDDNR